MKTSEPLYPKLSEERKDAFLRDLRQSIQQGAVKLPGPRPVSSTRPK
jgi:hypothetical protein